jgi:2-C-methyl-D-erythritol 2,4-cyclodiphosphate synthase
VLLRATRELLVEAGWRVVNVDSTISAQRPKMAPYIPSMAANIASDLLITVDTVSIKAKTAETLGFVGREEGISTQAVALIGQIS